MRRRYYTESKLWGHGCSCHSIMNYKAGGFPCVWNGIVHSLCHISACLTRQNKSFSIFQWAGADRVRRHGRRIAVPPPPVLSVPIWCPVLSPLVLGASLLPSLRLHRPEKHGLRNQSPRQHLRRHAGFDRMKPTRIDSQPSLSPIYHFLHLSCTTGYISFITQPP